MTPDFTSQDYYAVLGLPRSASADEIKQAYRSLAKKHHPDKNLDKKEEAEATFKKIQEAHSVLSDPEQRALYDNGGLNSEGAGFPSGFASAAGMPGGARINEAELNELLQSLLQGFGGIGGSSGASQFQFASGRRGQARATGYNWHISSGAEVVVRGLINAKEYNGKTAQVVGFNADRGRYDLLLDGSRPLSVLPKNVTQLCDVEVHGLVKKPELNGGRGRIFNFEEESGRYTVFLESPATQALSLLPANCILKKGTAVLLAGLSNQKFNGEMAVITAVDPDASRYHVKCRSGESIAVKFDKVVC
mmetsp:Transcript_63032/g.150176  ORF Transcript_63032/g.150176 Transcript_63032/m.150176 type:complete len:305 (-) Transcript_63032:89-1003(-)|eukprot:CAMPEP_0178411048 /NCGR_PEP_ID=MMETSP0689_2-20121128/21295_1 /TAXON_ID=160604 /ORGANISM="Amphidinium massartii, Strain CS-259" /LENGTH=304 /DNA_ID=CAMNT_0020032245 /DNA_START=63 /DNA_END=977 /DNA_ORIENTATION=+